MVVVYAPVWWNCVLWISSNNGLFFLVLLLSYYVCESNIIILQCVHTFTFLCGM